MAVASPEEALRAIGDAKPGDAITFLPGTYRFDGTYIAASQPATRAAPILVRAERPGSVVLEFNMVEGFLVSAPYWSFENLVIRGTCADHSHCEHAFHVVGNAAHFLARNNEIVDFNAHFKVNGSAGAYPDFGVIEGNTLRNDSVRDTGNPVTPIDLVAASHWRIRGNRISDFVKGRSDRISYGAFVKGGGADNRFERNVVVCEDRLRGFAGQRVGLSLGGGGSSADACRGGRCITEQDRGAIASNLIAACSDDGIYLNRAAASLITHNTLIDTGGITARFGESSADVEGNLVDGADSRGSTARYCTCATTSTRAGRALSRLASGAAAFCRCAGARSALARRSAAAARHRRAAARICAARRGRGNRPTARSRTLRAAPRRELGPAHANDVSRNVATNPPHERRRRAIVAKRYGDETAAARDHFGRADGRRHR